MRGDKRGLQSLKLLRVIMYNVPHLFATPATSSTSGGRHGEQQQCSDVQALGQARLQVRQAGGGEGGRGGLWGGERNPILFGAGGGRLGVTCSTRLQVWDWGGAGGGTRVEGRAERNLALDVGGRRRYRTRAWGTGRNPASGGASKGEQGKERRLGRGTWLQMLQGGEGGGRGLGEREGTQLQVGQGGQLLEVPARGEVCEQVGSTLHTAVCWHPISHGRNNSMRPYT